MVLRRAREQIENYEEAWSQGVLETAPEPSPAQNPALLWKAPPEGYIKLNWDAAVDKETKRVGLGVVARNHRGEVLAMYCDTKASTTAEALAASRAVLVAGNLAWNKIILEGDALEIVQRLSRSGSWMGSFGMVMEDMKTHLMQFQEWQVEHIPRCVNEVADSLAKLALHLSSEKLWVADFPSSILPRVIAEQGSH
ncbi:uncharacterized protein LOC132185379 [Corylus avellana]|uniref:uncharacterized protein LOC132185379 n=1 Tax=Corylus avellana TaxID=13451 RepID=UPI00286B5435|nr:uncharacterized protein LOC132185379 [Corylus avellana]